MLKDNQINPKLRKRFCKDFNVPINIFTDPEFTRKLETYFQYDDDTKFAWQRFKEMLTTFYEEYGEAAFTDKFLEYSNSLQEKMIEELKFKLADFNQKELPALPEIASKYPHHDIFKAPNAEKMYISIDMMSANFHSLREYDPNIFTNGDKTLSTSYKEWVHSFTTFSDYFAQSKGFRQCIFGNCNPKRQQSYEMYLMSLLVKDYLIPKDLDKYIVALHNDEIIISVPEDQYPYAFHEQVEKAIASSPIAYFLRIDMFKLQYIAPIKAFIKHHLFMDTSASPKKVYEFKCLPANIFHEVLCYKFRIPITKDDLAFISQDGRMAHYDEPIPNPFAQITSKI